MQAKGTLIPIGGNEDKGGQANEMYTLEYIEEGILSRVVKESGGADAKIVIIPTASRIPKQVSDTYVEAFARLGCKDIEVINIKNREHANDSVSLELIRQSNCVMFSGGDQSKITKYIQGTPISDLIIHKYLHEKFVIAGTSAGAMCMGTIMIKGGGAKETLTKGSVSIGKGMGFIHDFIIDSHFIQRKRFGRLTEAVARFPNKIGIGLAEDTGLIIKDGGSCEVIGSGMIILFDPTELGYNNVVDVSKGSPLTLTNLKTHVLSNGHNFRVEDSKINFTFNEEAVSQ